MQPLFRIIKDPTKRLYFAVFLFFASIIGWPLSALTLAKEEPPFILGLSWLAITLTALDIIVSSDVRKEQENDKDE